MTSNRKKYYKNYYDKNKERFIVEAKERCLKNREKRLEYAKKYSDDNPNILSKVP